MSSISKRVSCMAAVAAIEGFRIFTDQRAFSFKNLQRTPKLLPFSLNSFGIASAAAAAAAAVAMKSANVASASETNQNPHLQETAAKSKKAESKDGSLRCISVVGLQTEIEMQFNSALTETDRKRNRSPALSAT